MRREERPDLHLAPTSFPPFFRNDWGSRITAFFPSTGKFYTESLLRSTHADYTACSVMHLLLDSLREGEERAWDFVPLQHKDDERELGRK